MKFEDAFTALIGLDFRGFPGNDHTVAVGLGDVTFAHEYCWCDLKDAGKSVVDLFREQEGVTYHAAAMAILEQWNAAQVDRARRQVSQAQALQDVLRICS